jgi:hypothetical protein
MPAAQIPLWVTIAGSFGVGTFVGNLISFWLTSNLQRKNWMKDNKKQEWRELIDSLREALRVMAWHYDAEMPDQRRTAEEYRHREEAMRKGDMAIRDRIFIVKKVQDSGLFDQWVALSKECEEADVSFRERPNTLRSFIQHAHKFQNDLIQFSREDLGLDRPAWFTQWRAKR